MSDEMLSQEFILLSSCERSRTEEKNQSGLNNRQTHGIVTIAAVVLLLGAMGVPMYAAMEIGAYNAIPMDFGNINVQTQSIHVTGAGTMGDIVDYMLWHWGAYQPYAFLVAAISGAFTGAGVPIAGAIVSAAADAFLASGAVSVGSITDILLITVAAVDPVTLAIIGVVAAIIVGF